MYSFIVFSLTLLQLLIMGGSYFLQASQVFYTLVVYGSPFYCTMTLLRSDSAILDNNPIYLIMLIYHMIKYGMFFLAQRNEGQSGMLMSAIAFEALYLSASAYYLN